MKLFSIHPSDARWLRRWLANNLKCVVAIVCFVITIRVATSVPLTTMSQLHADQAASVSAEAAQWTAGHPIAVAPRGWRRTVNGWEDASTWPPQPRPLGEIIQCQCEREPAWVQTTLAKLRNVPPLLFALIQVTAIAAICSARSHKNHSLAGASESC